MTAPATVQTVLGPVAAGALGATLVHEHIFMGWPGWNLDPLAPDAKAEQYDTVVARLREAASAGVRTVVDATPADLGRDVALLQRVSRDTGLHVIAATGIYHESWGLPVYMKMRSVDELTAIFVHDLTEGVDGTTARAGVIKLASAGETIGRHEGRALQAAAAAAVQCAVPIITHASNAAVALDQAERLTSAGVPPHRVQIGHCDSFASADLERILATGVFVAIDQFVYPQKIDMAGRVATITDLINKGHLAQITLSHDQLGILGGRQVPLASTTRSFAYLLTEAVPLLRAAGVSDDMITTMLVRNPGRLFGGEAGHSDVGIGD